MMDKGVCCPNCGTTFVPESLNKEKVVVIGNPIKFEFTAHYIEHEAVEALPIIVDGMETSIYAINKGAKRAKQYMLYHDSGLMITNYMFPNNAIYLRNQKQLKRFMELLFERFHVRCFAPEATDVVNKLQIALQRAIVAYKQEV